MRQKRFAEIGHGIFYSWRYIRKQFPANYTICCQLFKYLRQNLFRYERYIAIQLIEAYRLIPCDFYKHDQCPFVSEPFKYRRGFAIFVV